MMRLAGIEVTEDSLLALVLRLRDADLHNQADRIVEALMSMQTEVTLEHPDRVAILTVLDHPPAGLEELRATLLTEHVGASETGSHSQPARQPGSNAAT